MRISDTLSLPPPVRRWASGSIDEVKYERRKFIDVVDIAYTASLGPPAMQEETVDGCARCSRTTEIMTAVGSVVSRRFTGYDTWTNAAAASLCEVCVWAHRYPPLRRVAHVVTRNPPALRAAAGPELRSVLSAPLSSGVAVIVPLTPGRKHLFPVARWGQITVDDGHLTWGSSDAEQLSVMCALRGLGFEEGELRMQVPTFRTLQGLPPNYLASVTADWKKLESWRAAPPWFEVGIRASRQAPA